MVLQFDGNPAIVCAHLSAYGRDGSVREWVGSVTDVEDELTAIANVALEMKMPPIDVTKVEVEESVQATRPYGLFLVLNLVVLGIACGPAVVAGVAGLIALFAGWFVSRRVLDEEIKAWVWVDDASLTRDRVEYHAQNVSNVITQDALEDAVSEVVRELRLSEAGYDAVEIAELSRNVDLATSKVSATGSREAGGLGSLALAMAMFFTLYIVLIVYGNQVLQGVLEEKSSRIVEVMLSAVTPVEMLAGKLAGICLLGLTQVSIWMGTALVLTAPGVIGALALSGSPQAAQAQSPCGSAVTVSPGDTLYRIAQECGTTVSALARHNGIANPNRIQVGQRIAMPHTGAGGAPPQARGLAPGERYRVRSGDTLYAISRQFGIPVQILLSLNPQLDPRAMPPGFVIRFPGDGEPPRRDRPDDDDRVTISGTVTGEGVECLAVRGDDGQLYTLAGDVGDLEPGDRVQVQGQRAEVSFCQQGTTIDVRRYRTIG